MASLYSLRVACICIESIDLSAASIKTPNTGRQLGLDFLQVFRCGYFVRYNFCEIGWTKGKTLFTLGRSRRASVSWLVYRRMLSNESLVFPYSLEKSCSDFGCVFPFIHKPSPTILRGVAEW